MKTSESNPSAKIVISILPKLTGSEMLQLIGEYKALYRNVSLHRHLKCTYRTTTPFGKLVSATSMGP